MVEFSKVGGLHHRYEWREGLNFPGSIFAKDRYHGKQVEWMAWENGENRNRLMILDTSLDGGVRMSPEKMVMNDLKQRLLTDMTFTDQQDHCRAYKMLFGNDGFVQKEYDNLGDKGCLVVGL